MEKSVTAGSSDEEIMAAINAAGDHRYPWRKHDWPDDSEGPDAKAWVMAGDIGYSTKRDRSLIKRLKGMVKKGQLEMRRYGCRLVINRRTFEEKTPYEGAPRFQVKR